MRKCYITRNYKDIHSAGGKAKTDIEATMQRLGFVNLGWKQTTYKNKVIDFLLTFTGVVKALLSLRKGDVLVLQYPMKKYYETVCQAAHWKGSQVVTQIHDLGSFRRKKLTVEREIQRLNHTDVIIAHNETMKQWIVEHGCKAQVTTLGIFDYLSPEPVQSQRELPAENQKYGFFFVGNMDTDQNAFLYDLSGKLDGHAMILYGSHFHKELVAPQAPVEYKGFAVDYELMKLNQGDFGLSWYGDSLSDGKGKIGEYMHYNNPHKVSLYLRCHCPVILSKTAGLARFVEENGVGITLENLEDLSKTLDSISLEQYRQMYHNVQRVSDRIASGYYFEHAFEKALQLL